MTPLASFNLNSLIELILGHSSFISPEESRRNLEQNVVGIYTLGRSEEGLDLRPTSAGCGVCLTTDGYILTANHVIEEALGTLHGENTNVDAVVVLDQQKKFSSLDPSFVISNPDYDLALVKMYRPEIGQRLRFNINLTGLYTSQVLTTVALNHTTGQIEISRGEVLSTDGEKDCYRSLSKDRVYHVLDSFSTSSIVHRGDSGGIFIDEAGSLVGTIIASNVINEEDKKAHGTASGVDIAYGLQMIYWTLEMILKRT